VALTAAFVGSDPPAFQRWLKLIRSPKRLLIWKH